MKVSVEIIAYESVEKIKYMKTKKNIFDKLKKLKRLLWIIIR